MFIIALIDNLVPDYENPMKQEKRRIATDKSSDLLDI